MPNGMAQNLDASGGYLSRSKSDSNCCFGTVEHEVNIYTKLLTQYRATMGEGKNIRKTKLCWKPAEYAEGSATKMEYISCSVQINMNNCLLASFCETCVRQCLHGEYSDFAFRKIKINAHLSYDGLAYIHKTFAVSSFFVESKNGIPSLGRKQQQQQHV